MSMVINTNPAATSASVNLLHSNSMLQKSLNRLSSGIKITSPADDAGGLAVSMKMQAAIRRTDATYNNVQNGISYLQAQDGALKTAGKILDRMSELKTLHRDVTKNESDQSNYWTEFSNLQSQLTALGGETFNSVALFNAVSDLEIVATESGATKITASSAGLTTALSSVQSITSANLGTTSISVITDAIQNVANLRATNGAQTSRLGFAAEMLQINKVNLESANSRIIDTDIAAESTAFARYNILVQSGTAMLAQANASSQYALRLLG